MRIIQRTVGLLFAFLLVSTSLSGQAWVFPKGGGTVTGRFQAGFCVYRRDGSDSRLAPSAGTLSEHPTEPCQISILAPSHVGFPARYHRYRKRRSHRKALGHDFPARGVGARRRKTEGRRKASDRLFGVQSGWNHSQNGRLYHGHDSLLAG